jgi:hypothetical protein
VPFIVLIMANNTTRKEGNYYGKDLWNKSLLESGI